MNLVNPYRFGNPFPVDLVSGFIHGWSTARKLRQAYSGFGMRVRNGSTGGSVFQIGFLNNVTNESQIPTFSGVNTIINDLYDQVGARDLTQSNTNFSPVVRNTSGVITKVSGRVYAQYDGSNDFLDTTGSATPITDKDCTVFVVFESQASDSNQTFFNERTANAFATNRIQSDTTNTVFRHSIYRPASGTTVLLAFSSQQPQSTKRCYIFRRSGNTIEAYDESGSLIDSDTASDIFPANTSFELGRFNGAGFEQYFGGKISELLINNTALSSGDMDLVRNNIKDFYSIT